MEAQLLLGTVSEQSSTFTRRREELHSKIVSMQELFIDALTAISAAALHGPSSSSAARGEEERAAKAERKAKRQRDREAKAAVAAHELGHAASRGVPLETPPLPKEEPTEEEKTFAHHEKKDGGLCWTVFNKLKKQFDKVRNCSDFNRDATAVFDAYGRGQRGNGRKRHQGRCAPK